MPCERKINTYVLGDSESGTCVAGRDTRICLAYRIPRLELKGCDKKYGEKSKPLHTPGVYFMLGREDETGRDFVYIGEGTDVLKRIRGPHDFDKNGKRYWQDVIVIVTDRPYFDKDKIKYLEKRFIKLAKEAGRYHVVNTNTLENTKSSVSESDCDTLEEMIGDIRLLLFSLGDRVLVPQPSQTSIAEEDMLFFSWSHSKTTSTGTDIITSGKAIGVRKEDGFWVLKGSIISKTDKKYLPSGYQKLREQYKDLINKKQQLTKDIMFNSPSAASSFVCGRNSNGLTDWKNKDGIPLKELDADDSSSEPTELPAPATRNRQTGRRRSETTLPASVEMLSLASKIPARGYYLADSNELVVLKGSKMNPKLRSSCDAGIAKERDNLVKTGKVKNYEFKEDVTFSSPSTAAAVIAGGNSNGWDLWRDSRGRKLKDIIKR